MWENGIKFFLYFLYEWYVWTFDTFNFVHVLFCLVYFFFFNCRNEVLRKRSFNWTWTFFVSCCDVLYFYSLVQRETSEKAFLDLIGKSSTISRLQKIKMLVVNGNNLRSTKLGISMPFFLVNVTEPTIHKTSWLQTLSHDALRRILIAN